MEQDSTTTPGGMEPFSGEAWFDPIEAGVRERVRGFIEELLEQELTAALGRQRCRSCLRSRRPCGSGGADTRVARPHH
jgi:hypothetical protein